MIENIDRYCKDYVLAEMRNEPKTLKDHLGDVIVDGSTIVKRNFKTSCLTSACELY
jgi:hypothetical protein